MVKFPSSCELSMNINSLHSPPYLSRKKKSKKLKELVNGKLSLQKRGKKPFMLMPVIRPHAIRRIIDDRILTLPVTGNH